MNNLQEQMVNTRTKHHKDNQVKSIKQSCKICLSCEGSF